MFFFWILSTSLMTAKNDMFKHNKKLALFLITFIVFRFNSTAEAQ